MPLTDVLLADGANVIRSQISESIIGIRSQIGPGARIDRTVMMGADYFEREEDRLAKLERGIPAMGVGPGCTINWAIIDKNACIGEGVAIRPLPDRPDMDEEHYAVRDGIVIVTKNAVIPAGTLI